jgi:hypothetical protein
MIPVAELQNLYHQFNAEHFDGVLPPCTLSWSRALTRTAGNIDVRRRAIKLSVPLLIEAFRRDSLFAPQYTVCGVQCDNCESAVREILKHEMIHLWLYEKGLPHGHTPEFRHKARELGQPKTRHQIALPAPSSGWEYLCAHCGDAFTRRRRYGRPVACARCCKRFNKGRYDARFKLKGRRIAAAGV